MLTILPTSSHKYQPTQPKYNLRSNYADTRLALLHTLVTTLRENAGFCIPKVRCMKFVSVSIAHNLVRYAFRNLISQ